MTASLRARLGRALPSVLALLAGASATAAAATAAQGTAASDTNVVLVQGVPAAGGASAAPSGAGAVATVAQPLAGAEAASAGFGLQPSVAWGAPVYAGDGPLVVGVDPGVGDALGGDVVLVRGFHFAAPGAGVTSVEFAGGPGTATAVLGNTRVETTLPAGVNAFANPLPLSGAEVVNALGAHGVEGAVRYLPAFEQGTTARLGGRVKVRLHTEPGALNALLLGGSVAGLGVPVAPYEGSLRAIVGLQVVAAVPSDATGTFGTTFPLPSSPSFLGAVIELQAMSFEDPGLTSGAFTNLLAIPVL